eukprot:TRINITY_DN81805_c0_g1_i1.p1 TRINITY_DN81805_c0_g1~~TRINITY_DN81805_c0_g1_i1.p1  ORF type:complete len:137 (+),score=25.05 TRINITY_DN81805_c0_g1_i1:50-460(+)
MSGSGITPTDECMSAYTTIKTKRDCRFVEMAINDGQTAIEVTKKGERNATFADWVAQLPKDKCRYYLFDYEFKNSDGTAKDKLVFIVWAPDNCKVKEKMLCASSKEALRSKMEGVVEIQFNDVADCQEAEVAAKCK